MKYLHLLLLILLLNSCLKSHTKLGIEVAKQELEDALVDRNRVLTSINSDVNNKLAAIAIAEPILFKIYGEKEIINERPYEIYLINGYWVLNGTLPEHTYGGVFLIIISAKDGRIIEIAHGK